MIRRERGMNRRPELNPSTRTMWPPSNGISGGLLPVCDGLLDDQATERACREMNVPLLVEITAGRTIDPDSPEASTRIPSA